MHNLFQHERGAACTGSLLRKNPFLFQTLRTGVMECEVERRDLKRRGKNNTLAASKESRRSVMRQGRVFYDFSRLKSIIFQQVPVSILNAALYQDCACHVAKPWDRLRTRLEQERGVDDSVHTGCSAHNHPFIPAAFKLEDLESACLAMSALQACSN